MVKPPPSSWRSSGLVLCCNLTSLILSSTNSSVEERSLRRRFLFCLSNLCFLLATFGRVSCSGEACSSYSLTIWHILLTVALGIISLTISGEPCLIAQSVHKASGEIFLSNIDCFLWFFEKKGKNSKNAKIVV